MAFDKTKPAGTTPLKTSDDQIRANNEALEAAIGQDHDFATGGSDPSWIEGSGSSPSTPTIRNGGFRSGGIR